MFCRYYCDEEGISFDQMIADKRCPSGYYCDEGLTDESDKIDCKSGQYCPEATLEPVKCPPGTINKNKNGKSVQDCAK